MWKYVSVNWGKVGPNICLNAFLSFCEPLQYFVGFLFLAHVKILCIFHFLVLKPQRQAVFLGRFSATLCLALFPTPQPIILRSIKHVSKLKEHHSPRSTPNRIFFRSIKHVSSARNVNITDPASPPHPSIARRTPDGKNHLKQRDRY